MDSSLFAGRFRLRSFVFEVFLPVFSHRRVARVAVTSAVSRCTLLERTALKAPPISLALGTVPALLVILLSTMRTERSLVEPSSIWSCLIKIFARARDFFSECQAGFSSPSVLSWRLEPEQISFLVAAG